MADNALIRLYALPVTEHFGRGQAGVVTSGTFQLLMPAAKRESGFLVIEPGGSHRNGGKGLLRVAIPAILHMDTLVDLRMTIRAFSECQSGKLLKGLTVTRLFGMAVNTGSCSVLPLEGKFSTVMIE